jgi:hypothetical protein
MTVDEKLDAVLRASRETSATVANLAAYQKGQDRRLDRLEEAVTTVRRSASDSHHHFEQGDMVLVRALTAHKTEADARHAELTAQIVAVKQTGSFAPVIRELRFGFTVFGALVLVGYLLHAKILVLTPEQTGALGSALVGAVVVFLKVTGDKTKAEKRAAATIPPPPESP